MKKIKKINYTYQELEALANEYEKALDVQTKFVETYIRFIYSDEEIEEKFKKFILKELEKEIKKEKSRQL